MSTKRGAIRQQARDGRLPDMDWPLFMAEVAPRLDPLLRPLFDAMQERGDPVPQVTWRLRRYMLAAGFTLEPYVSFAGGQTFQPDVSALTFGGLADLSNAEDAP